MPAPTDVHELSAQLLVTSARLTRLAARVSGASAPVALVRSLAQLEEQGPLRVSELAALDRVSQPTATTLVQKLAERGWADRGADPVDARAVLVTITPAGRQVLAQVRTAAAEALVPRLERLDEASRRALADGVTVLARLVDGEAG
ncbi:MarR family winged helix-turn-helix transcriptional regulator [Angustibacter aerolatus]